MIAPVDARRIGKLTGDRCKIAHQDQHGERYSDGRIREDRGKQRVQDVKVAKRDEHRREEHGDGQHLGDKKAEDEKPLAFEREPRDTVRRRYRQNKGDEHGAGRYDDAVAEGAEHVEIPVLDLREVGIRVQLVGTRVGGTRKISISFLSDVTTIQ